MLDQPDPVLIFLPVLKSERDPNRMSDRVGIGAAYAAARLTAALTGMRHSYVIKAGDNLSFADLRRQPAMQMRTTRSSPEFWISKTGNTLMIACGLTTFGTQIAAELLVDPRPLAKLLSQAPSDWKRRNFQALIHTRIIGSTPGPPDILETYFW